ncbi:unnamed protein product [Cylindrotheca closterium]|uniref:PDZ domain-containing protein n=1 Tax=Cylindrotheca closterium TaxID=2856 RepID=A0AAD2CIF9_9STRA|nr:unnamed protein product [Cylindrotheca closterium]
MKRKMRLLRAIRNKKKTQSNDESPPQSDLTGIHITVESKSTPPIEDRQVNEPSEQASIVGPEQDKMQQRNIAIQEMIAKNAYLEKVAYSTNITKTHKPKEDSEGGGFFCMCGNLGNACSEGEEIESISSKAIRTYRIMKDNPSEKVGLSFVAFKQQGGIFVCKIKEGSKFNETGLEVGMRVVSINGTPCPERVGALMKILKKVEKELELQVERVGSIQEKKVEVQVPKEEAAPRKTEAVPPKREVEKPMPALATPLQEVDNSERRLYSSDIGLENSEPEFDESENDSKAELNKKKLELMRKQVVLMKKNGTVSFAPIRRDPHVVPKDVEGEDTDETGSSSSEHNDPYAKIYDSDSSQGSSTFATNESSAYNGMDRFASIVDDFVRADEDKFAVKKSESFTISEIANKIKEGAPVWMFFE